MKNFFEKHQKLALMFSGGKDSIICLDLIKEYLDKTVVIWVNTGANFPEVVSFIEKVKTKVPNFMEIKTNQPKVILEKGYPVDVLPINYTDLGQVCTSNKALKLRSYFDCCGENFWWPCYEAIKNLGITGVIKGQRLAESHKSPVKSGEYHDGIEYFFPLENWSDKQVIDYLEKNGLLNEERLKIGHSSLDCWNCTAYLNDSKNRMQYIKINHPEKFKEIKIILEQINHAVQSENGINNILNM
jgi:3'-phosphoadenosine 5'-phosphosulfate sulfotransferase (PAPS reductase)/FAD synthetase